MRYPKGLLLEMDKKGVRLPGSVGMYVDLRKTSLSDFKAAMYTLYPYYNPEAVQAEFLRTF